MNFLIEIATNDFETTRAAVEGGADRIELCSALSEGGLTPSFGLLKRCREQFSLPIFPIIRPRGGDFLYTDEEFAVMAEEIRLCRALGFEGVVLGLLLPDGRIDRLRTARLIELAFPMEVTFHRAFDRCADPFIALEELVALGCQRILTSGQQPTAPEALPLIRQLNEQAAGRITIMPGSGVRKENIRAIAEATGTTELHTSLRSRQASAMSFVHTAFAGNAESYQNPGLRAEDVRALRRALEEPTN